MQQRTLLLLGLLALASFVTFTCALPAPVVEHENDVAALNYALSLARLNFQLYFTGQGLFNDAAFVTAGYATGVYNYMGIMCRHYLDQMDVLTDLITKRGGEVVDKEACEYDFSSISANPDAYVAAANSLEETTMQAFGWTMNALTDPELQKLLASMTTISARHTAYLSSQKSNSVTPDTPAAFPSSADTLLDPSDVQQEVSQFFSGTCELPQPTVRPAGVKAATVYSSATKSASTPLSSAYYSQRQFDNDLAVLQYLLVLEQYAWDFLSYADMQFGAQAPYSTHRDQLRAISTQKRAHVTALRTFINKRGGAAKPNCPDNFNSVTSASSFLAAIGQASNNQVAAFVGALGFVTDTDLQLKLAGIATNNARHAAVINGFNGKEASIPNPPGTFASFDPSATPTGTYTSLSNGGHFTYNSVDLTCGSSAIALSVPVVIPALNAESNDIATLNAAIHLLNLQFSFYFWGLGADQFPVAEFESGGFGASVYNNFTLACMQDGSQRDLLRTIVSAHGGVGATGCTFDFGSTISTLEEYVAAASELENDGVSLLANLIQSLSDPELQQTVSQILLVQGRQAGYVGGTLSEQGQWVNGQSGLESILSLPQFQAKTKDYITGCSYKLENPLVRPSGVATLGTPSEATPSSLAPKEDVFYAAQDSETDNDAIKYAIKILDTQFNLYFLSLGKEGMTKADFVAAGMQETVYDHYSIMCAQDGAASQELKNILEARGEAAGAGCEYNQTLGGINRLPANKRAVALVKKVDEFESSGAHAFAGLLALVTDTRLQTTLAQIAAFQGRHAGYALNQLANIAFPDELEPLLTPTETNAELNELVISCSAEDALPERTTYMSIIYRDLDVLQYVLSVLHLESAMWTFGWTEFNLGNAAGYGASVESTSEQLDRIWKIKQAQVTGVARKIAELGGVPRHACEYDFSSVTTLAQFMTLAKSLTNTGVQVINAAPMMLTDPELQSFVASIAETEGRHSSFINRAINPAPDQGSPAAYDEILRTMSSYDAYQTCSFDASIVPPLRPSAVAFDTMDDPLSSSPQPETAYTTAQQENDLTVLKYLEFLEMYQFNFYYDATHLFEKSAFVSAGYPGSIYDAYTIQCMQDGDHRDKIRARITARSGAANPLCTMNFASHVGSVQQFVSFARMVESLVSGAYVDVISRVVDVELQEFVQSIGSVQGRHAAFNEQAITKLDGTTLSSVEVFEPANTPAVVLQTLRDAIGLNCDFTLPQPLAAPLGPSAPTPQPITDDGTPGEPTDNHNAGAAFASSPVGGLVALSVLLATWMARKM